MTPFAIQIILSTKTEPDPATQRLIQALDGDPRYDLLPAIWIGDTAPNEGRFPRYLAAEAKLFARSGASTKRKPPSTDDISPPPETVAKPRVLIDLTGAQAALAMANTADLGLLRPVDYAAQTGIDAALARQSATTLQLEHVEAPEAAPRVVASAGFTTKFIASRQIPFMRKKYVSLLLHTLARLAATGTLPAPATPTHKSRTPPVLVPYVSRMTSELALRGRSKLLQKAGRKPGQWCLMTGTGTWADFDPARGTLIEPQGNSYWADPFLFRQQGQLYVFFEDYDYATSHGFIGAGRLDNGVLRDVTRVLERPYHLSYPQVFAHNGQIYMLPETSQAGRIEIWRATEFPHRWELHATGLEGMTAADTVLFPDGDGWWLFTNTSSPGDDDLSSELCLFRTTGPDLQRIVPHPLNPVVVGSPTARGAGRVFRDGDRIVRASQRNTHGTYGWGLNLMEVTELSSTRYEERLVRTITPDFAPGYIGCHHFDQEGDTWIIDVRKQKGHWAK